LLIYYFWKRKYQWKGVSESCFIIVAKIRFFAFQNIVYISTARCDCSAIFILQSKTNGKKNERIKWSTKRTSATLWRNSILWRGVKKILIVLNSVAAAYSAIKGSAIKGSEAANGEEVFLRETCCYCSGFLEQMSQCPPPRRAAVDKCTRNLTRIASPFLYGTYLYSMFVFTHGLQYTLLVFPAAHLDSTL